MSERITITWSRKPITVELHPVPDIGRPFWRGTIGPITITKDPCPDGRILWNATIDGPESIDSEHGTSVCGRGDTLEEVIADLEWRLGDIVNWAGHAGLPLYEPDDPHTYCCPDCGIYYGNHVSECRRYPMMIAAFTPPAAAR